MKPKLQLVTLLPGIWIIVAYGLWHLSLRLGIDILLSISLFAFLISEFIAAPLALFAGIFGLISCCRNWKSTRAPIFYACAHVLFILIVAHGIFAIKNGFIETSLVRRLMTINKSLNKYHEEHGLYPEQGLTVLGLSDHSLIDPFTDELFLYHPDTTDFNTPIVEQASEYRLGLWPFGEVRRYGIFKSGGVGNILTYEPPPVDNNNRNTMKAQQSGAGYPPQGVGSPDP